MWQSTVTFEEAHADEICQRITKAACIPASLLDLWNELTPESCQIWLGTICLVQEKDTTEDEIVRLANTVVNQDCLGFTCGLSIYQTSVQSCIVLPTGSCICQSSIAKGKAVVVPKQLCKTKASKISKMEAPKISKMDAPKPITEMDTTEPIPKPRMQRDWCHQLCHPSGQHWLLFLGCFMRQPRRPHLLASGPTTKPSHPAPIYLCPTATKPSHPAPIYL